jgi:multidrug resistance efflux pump
VKPDTVVAILAVIVITAAIVGFIWWRSTKTLMSTQHPDRARAMLISDAHGS